MTNRERVFATFEGRPVDRFPVAALYECLFRRDHFTELSGLPAGEQYRIGCASPEEYADVYLTMMARAPFEVLQPDWAPPREWRERCQWRWEGDSLLRREGPDGDWQAVWSKGQPMDTTCLANETRYLRDKADVDECVTVTPAEVALEAGLGDYIQAVKDRVGDREFLCGLGVNGALWNSTGWLGMANAYAAIAEEPEFYDYLVWKLTEQNLELVRQFAAMGVDAITIDESGATSDMISPRQFERFCAPTTKAVVDEARRLGLKTIIMYWGGVMDRLDLIAGIAPDAILVEASMKGYTNDIGAIAEAIGDQISLFGNLNPHTELELVSDSELERLVAAQGEAGRKARGFFISPASPITPDTPLARVQRFIELARSYGAS